MAKKTQGDKVLEAIRSLPKEERLNLARKLTPDVRATLAKVFPSEFGPVWSRAEQVHDDLNLEDFAKQQGIEVAQRAKIPKDYY